MSLTRLFPVAHLPLAARLVLAAAAQLVLASAVDAQHPEFTDRVDAQTLAVVQPLLEGALRDSLPVAALQAKVLEGVAKRVPAPQIERVVSELADEFRAVRIGLRQRLPSAVLMDAEIVAAAMASRHGVALDDLRAVWESRPNGSSLDVPVTVLGELVRRGVPAQEATEVMSYLVQERVPLSLAAQIPGKLDGAAGAGVSPVAALTEALRVLNIPNPSGRRPGG